MPPVAQGIRKQTCYGKQTALGTPKTGAGGQILRRKTAVFSATRDMFENDEIVSHQQSTGVTYGLQKAGGKIDALLSAGTYKDLIAAALRKAFTATAAITGLSLTIAGSNPYTLARGTGSYLSDGLKVGDVVRLSVGSLNAANINKNLLVTAVVALTATVVPLNGVAMVAEGPIATTTMTVIGKKSLVPLTGHTDDFFTFEEWYADLTRSEIFTDAKIAKVQIDLPSTGLATLSFEVVALDRTIAGAQSFTAPATETTTAVLGALNGMVFVNGTKVTNVTGAQVTIDCGIKPVSAVLGSNFSPDMDRGRIQVSGSFTALFDSATLSSLYDTEAVTSIVLVVASDPSATADFFTITMGRVKLTGDTPDDGEKSIIRTYPFTAELNSAGGPTLNWDQTIVTIQDSQA